MNVSRKSSEHCIIFEALAHRLTEIWPFQGIDSTSGGQSPEWACEKSDTEEPTTVVWRIYLDTAFEVTLVRDTNAYDVGRNGIIIAETGEKATFDDNMLRFVGNTASRLSLSIRVPAGNMRVLWNGEELVIDNRYVLTEDQYAIRYTPFSREGYPPVIFIDCFGQREARLHLRHYDNVYALRFESDYPVSVLPMSEYLMVQLSILRDHRISAQNQRIQNARGRERPHTPCTPPWPRDRHPTGRESEYDSPNTNQSLSD